MSTDKDGDIHARKKGWQNFIGFPFSRKLYVLFVFGVLTAVIFTVAIHSLPFCKQSGCWRHAEYNHVKQTGSTQMSSGRTAVSYDGGWSRYCSYHSYKEEEKGLVPFLMLLSDLPGGMIQQLAICWSIDSPVFCWILRALLVLFLLGFWLNLVRNAFL